MNDKLIETFLSLSNTLNITETASNLYLSQSTVSYRLNSLENELGVRLFDRKKGFKKIELTKDGEEFYRLCLDYENINNKIKDFSSIKGKEQISIGIVDSVNNHLFINAYKEILSEENIQLSIKTEHTEEIYNKILYRHIDIGFVLHHIPMSSIIIEELLCEEMVLLTKNVNFNNNNIVNADDLDPSKQIFLNWGDDYLKWHNSYFNKDTQPKILTDSSWLSLILMNDSLWMIAPISVANSLRKTFSDVNILHFQDSSPYRTIYMITNENPLKNNLETINDLKKMIYKYSLEV